MTSIRANATKLLRTVCWVELAALAALSAVAWLVGIGLAVRTLIIAEGGSSPVAVMMVGASQIFVVGLLPTVMYGAPVFTWYLSEHKPPRWLLYVLAALPGGILFAAGAGWVGVLAGIMVACVLEAVASRWLRLARGPNR